MAIFRILAINPGSTSTKIAVFENEKPIFIKNVKHSAEDLAAFPKISDQYEYRKNLILSALEHEEIAVDSLNAVIGRGGLIKPIPSGVYEVNQQMKEDLINAVSGEHASNLGGLIADNIAQSLPNHIKAYIADPVVVDEMTEIAHLSGHPKFRRKSIFHALNQKAIARTYGLSVHKTYEEMNLVIAHMGGGISVGAHQKGFVVDVNNALDGEGPFSPERSGTLPTGQLVEACFNKKYTEAEMKKMLVGEGGMMAYTGTNNAYDIELRAKDGDKFAQLIQNAMSYQVSKLIGEMAVVLKGDVDAIILTGGIAHSSDVCTYIRSMVEFIAPVIIYAGEDEMRALAVNVLRVLRGEIEPKLYQ